MLKSLNIRDILAVSPQSLAIGSNDFKQVKVGMATPWSWFWEKIISKAVVCCVFSAVSFKQ